MYMHINMYTCICIYAHRHTQTDTHTQTLHTTEYLGRKVAVDLVVWMAETVD